MPGASLGIRLFVLLSVFFVRFDIRLAVGTYVCVCVCMRERERERERENERESSEREDVIACPVRICAHYTHAPSLPRLHTTQCLSLCDRCRLRKDRKQGRGCSIPALWWRQLSTPSLAFLPMVFLPHLPLSLGISLIASIDAIWSTLHLVSVTVSLSRALFSHSRLLARSLTLSPNQLMTGIIYICVHIHTYTHTYDYIHIYIDR